MLDERHRVRLLDAHLSRAATCSADASTVNGFGLGRFRGRIDWILHTPELKAVTCDVVHEHEGVRYPSDHFPVSAGLQFDDTGKP